MSVAVAKSIILNALESGETLSVSVRFSYYMEDIEISKSGNLIKVKTSLNWGDSYEDLTESFVDVVSIDVLMKFLNDRLFEESRGIMNGYEIDMGDFLQEFTKEVRRQSKEKVFKKHCRRFKRVELKELQSFYPDLESLSSEELSRVVPVDFDWAGHYDLKSYVDGVSEYFTDDYFDMEISNSYVDNFINVLESRLFLLSDSGLEVYSNYLNEYRKKNNLDYRDYKNWLENRYR